MNTATIAGQPTVESMSTEITTWYQGKEFAFDWTSPHFPVWIPILAPLRGKPIRILEIGSYEGRSALFFLNYLRHSTIVCVDPWETADLDQELAKRAPRIGHEFPFVQGRFDRNLAPFRDRVTKIVANSVDALATLGLSGTMFELIYVDGDHKSLSAYRDCALSWPLLIGGGLLIIDDYEIDFGLPDDQRPKRGVDAFLRHVAGQCEELHRGYQMIIRRLQARTSDTGSTGGAWAKALGYFLAHRDVFLRHYHKRTNVESTFSMIKRKFGDALRSLTRPQDRPGTST